MDGVIPCDVYRPGGGEIPLDLCLQMGLLDAVGGTCTASRGSGGGIAVQPAVMRAFVECRQVSVGMQTAQSALMLPASAAVSAVVLHGVSWYGWDVGYAHLP